MRGLFMGATLTRSTITTSPDVDSLEPPDPIDVDYPCKAIVEEYSAGVRGQGLVGARDVQVLILATSLEVEPQPLDQITIRNATYTIVPADAAGMKGVRTDPAQATWQCRCTGNSTPDGLSLLEDGSFALREDGGYELRE